MSQQGVASPEILETMLFPALCYCIGKTWGGCLITSSGRGNPSLDRCCIVKSDQFHWFIECQHPYGAPTETGMIR